MSHHNSRRREQHQPPINLTDLDAFLLEDDLDDTVECQVTAIRESLADHLSL